MYMRRVNEALTIDCTRAAEDIHASAARYYLHRYLCSLAEYIFTVMGKETGIPDRQEIYMGSLSLTVDEESMTITKPEEIFKLLAFSGLMHTADHIAYEGAFSYNDRSSLERFTHKGPVESEYVPAENYFGAMLEKPDFSRLMTFRSVVEEEDPSERSIISLTEGETALRLDDAAFSRDVVVTRKVTAWSGSWIEVSIHFPEDTEEARTQRILNGLRELCRIYGDENADNHIDTFQGEYDIGFATGLAFTAEQQGDALGRISALVDEVNAASGSASFEGDLEAKESPFILCRLQSDDEGQLRVSYAVL